MTYLATPQHKDPCSGGQEIYNLGRPLLGYHYYTLSLSDLCMGVEKKIFKEIMHFHYMNFMASPCTRSPDPGGHEIYNLGRPFLRIYLHLVCLNHALELRSRFLKKYINFTLFTPKLPPLEVGDHEISYFLTCFFS